MGPELIADYACHTGEGPLWHPDEKRLYWVDIPAGRLFWYEPATGKHEMGLETEAIGGFTVQVDGALLLFMARGAVKSFRDGQLETIIEDIPDERETRFNDVFADPEGRVFCGTMAVPGRQGRLYRLNPDCTLTLVLEDIGCPNGMGFTPDLAEMYFTDSGAQTIYVFDYERESGEISNQRVFAKSSGEPGEGVPDGMTVDCEGYVWSARWNGSCVVRYAPDGEEVQRIAIPALKASCCTFGGEDYADMYVTTAGGNEKATEGVDAGALFRVDAGVRGVAEFRSRIGL